MTIPKQAKPANQAKHTKQPDPPKLPPPLNEQKRLRRKDNTIVPSAPYLMISHVVDIGCDYLSFVPLVRGVCCHGCQGCDANDDNANNDDIANNAAKGVLSPNNAANANNAYNDDGNDTNDVARYGAWRLLLPHGLGEFPHGKLSHSFSSYFGEEIQGDLSYADFLRGLDAESSGGAGSAKRKGLSFWKRNTNDNGNGNSTNQHTHLNLYATLQNTYQNPQQTYTHLTHTLSTTLSHMSTYAFQTPSTHLADLTTPLSLQILFLLVLLFRWVKRLLLPRFSALGKRLGRAAHGEGWDVGNQDRIVKFGEYVYRLVYHSTVSGLGVWYFRDKIWWDIFPWGNGTDGSRGGSISSSGGGGGMKHLWLGFPNHPVEPGMAWYYLVQCAYNVDALVSLVELSFVVEWVNPLAYSSALDDGSLVHSPKHSKSTGKPTTKPNYKPNTKPNIKPNKPILWTPLLQISYSPTIRGDFREMMAHHLVTNLLILASSHFRLTRIGSMIFLLHDLSDVPIDMSKLANFVKWKTTTIVCFVIMVLMWIITRLVIFPFGICKSVLVDSHRYLVVEGPLDPALYEGYYFPFYALLACLVMLHVTWFWILLRIGWTLVRTGERHDLSEHKGGERQDHGDKKRN